MSVALADFWISDVWRSVRDDVARIQKTPPTGKSGTKYGISLFRGDVIAERAVKLGVAGNLAWAYPDHTKHRALCKDITLGAVIIFATGFVLARPKEVARRADDDASIA